MLADEQIISFSEAAKLLPTHPHARTIWRWGRKGVRGIKLEVLRLGGRFVTSIQALERFGRALAETDAEPTTTATVTAPKPRSDAQRETAIARAEARLRNARV